MYMLLLLFALEPHFTTLWYRSVDKDVYVRLHAAQTGLHAETFAKDSRWSVRYSSLEHSKQWELFIADKDKRVSDAAERIRDGREILTLSNYGRV